MKQTLKYRNRYQKLHLANEQENYKLTKGKAEMTKTYFAGQLDFTTSPLVINVFMQLHPLYQSLGELPNCPGFPFAFSVLRT